jgi:O-antigen/teichoic acid export membrane protein
LNIPYNIIANYLGRGYSIASIYIFVPFYVRILGVEAYGIIAIYTILLTIAGLADIGLLATFSREAAKSKDKKKLLDLLATFERVLSLTLGVFVLAVLLGAEFLATYWLNTEGAIEVEAVTLSLRLMALMTVPQMLITLYTAGLLGLQRQVMANVLQSFFITARSCLVIFPILWRPELSVFFTWQIGATIVFVLIARVTLLRAMGHSGLKTGRFSRNLLNENLVFAGGMLWISVVSSLNTQIDKLIVSKLFSLSELGYYTLAASLAQLPVALATPIAVAFYPLITGHVGNGNKASECFAFENYGRWIVFAGGTGSLIVAFFSSEILSVWLQNPNMPDIAAQISTCLAIGSLFLCMGMPSYYLSLAHGESGLVAKIITITLLLSIPGMVFSVQYFGLLGVTIPWILLNFANVLLLLAMATRQHLSDMFVEVTLYTVIPALCVSLVFVLGARIAANYLQLADFFSLVMVGAAAGLASILFCLLPPPLRPKTRMNW